MPQHFSFAPKALNWLVIWVCVRRNDRRRHLIINCALSRAARCGAFLVLLFSPSFLFFFSTFYKIIMNIRFETESGSLSGSFQDAFRFSLRSALGLTMVLHNWPIYFHYYIFFTETTDDRFSRPSWNEFRGRAVESSIPRWCPRVNYEALDIWITKECKNPRETTLMIFNPFRAGAERFFIQSAHFILLPALTVTAIGLPMSRCRRWRARSADDNKVNRVQSLIKHFRSVRRVYSPPH